MDPARNQSGAGSGVEPKLRIFSLTDGCIASCLGSVSMKALSTPFSLMNVMKCLHLQLCFHVTPKQQACHGTVNLETEKLSIIYSKAKSSLQATQKIPSLVSSAALLQVTLTWFKKEIFHGAVEFSNQKELINSL